MPVFPFDNYDLINFIFWSLTRQNFFPAIQSKSEFQSPMDVVVLLCIILSTLDYFLKVKESYFSADI